MFNLTSLLLKVQPKEVKVVASNKFLDKVDHIDDIRVSKERDNVGVKVNDLPPPPTRVSAPTHQRNEMPAHKQLKVVASGNFLDSLNNISDIRETKVKEIGLKREETSKTSYQEAMSIIDRLVRSPKVDLNELEIAANKLIVSIENNKSNAEAYLKLASIFYVLKNIPASIRYLKIARSINPAIPEIKKLERILSLSH